MSESFSLETPLWEIVARATVVYLAIAVLLRLAPKRYSGKLAPNDMMATIIVGSMAGYAIKGTASSVPDLLLMALVVLGWSYVLNIAEFRFPRLRGVVQDSPTLLIHNGQVLQKNLRLEKLTEEELAASLREQGVVDVRKVKLAVLEVDGRISVVARD
ncbi:MAG: DUF421 domain-containing protein [Myxococcales bacterium]